MRTPDDHPTRREAEQLLDDPAAHGSALGSLLSAASAPALPGELRREDAEVAAFHRARLTPSTTRGAGFVSPRRLASRAAARAVIATGAVVAVTTGGFALANTAHLPGLPGQASDQATESVTKTPRPTATSTSASTAPSTSTSATDPSGTPSRSTESSPSASSAPTPNYEGLCRAFQAVDRSANGSSLDSAAFAALSAAAGGGDSIATWCVALIGEPQETGKPSVLPTPTARPTPTSKPTPVKPTDRPTGKPSQLPTPTTQPTGKPSTAPGTPTDKPSPTDQGGGRKP
ncbi:hypothetical protein [Nocardioides zhouii]|uniref:Uncharacterized protein n=1 Tax=Nocardioides zhouii TaxID=1168729 RepID=A0A4Q2T0M1_9ACTN|nr:hypothetical protein [Nocardioides zhouii]RYC11513.1 hypothetical protein EUA94_09110 [Nocardioides zhouii]